MKRTSIKVISLILASLFVCLTFAACGKHDVKKDLCAYDTWLWNFDTNTYMFFCFEEDDTIYARAYYGQEYLSDQDGTYEIKENQIIVHFEEGGKTAIDYAYVDGKLSLSIDGEALEPDNFDSD